MTHCVRKMFATGLAIGVLGCAAEGHASTELVQLSVEGNPSCSTYAVNQTILEARVTSVSTGFFTATGPSGQTVTGNVNGSRTALEEFEASTPVNFVILKQSGRAIVYHYGDDGVSSDEDLLGPNSGSFSAMSFCYGLPATVTQPTPLPECSDLPTAAQCPTEGNSELVLVTWNLANPNELITCTCNVMFTTCDLSPNATTNKCFPKTLNEVESIATFYNTPFCLTTSTGGTPRSGGCK